jgi:hypothetical protein
MLMGPMIPLLFQFLKWTTRSAWRTTGQLDFAMSYTKSSPNVWWIGLGLYLVRLYLKTRVPSFLGIWLCVMPYWSLSAFITWSMVRISTNNNFRVYKLDLSKAYDRVVWSFQESKMHKMGFLTGGCNGSWRLWPWWNIQLNLIEPCWKLSPQQEDYARTPLSPFLFLFVTDDLSALLQHEVEAGGISPIKVCRNAPGTSHLLFADDTLLFFRATTDQATRAKDVLDIYEKGTGGPINQPAKCSALFSTVFSQETQDEYGPLWILFNKLSKINIWGNLLQGKNE